MADAPPGGAALADKEYVLGNKARELLTYTNQATKIVTDDVSQRDVRKILQKIAALDDIRDVKQVCGQMIGYLDRKDKQGFTKAAYRCYGEDMRKTAKGIVRDIHAANTPTGRCLSLSMKTAYALSAKFLTGAASCWSTFKSVWTWALSHLRKARYGQRRCWT